MNIFKSLLNSYAVAEYNLMYSKEATLLRNKAVIQIHQRQFAEKRRRHLVVSCNWHALYFIVINICYVLYGRYCSKSYNYKSWIYQTIIIFNLCTELIYNL